MGWFVALLLSSVVWAQDAPPADASAPAAAEAPAAEAEEGDEGDDDAPPPARKVIRVREKEADGSQAPNRFTGDPVIRSRYQLNGQSLEVDPD